jgi:hypothetical protein
MAGDVESQAMPDGGAQLFSPWPLSAWLDESGRADFCQRYFAPAFPNAVGVAFL